MGRSHPYHGGIFRICCGMEMRANKGSDDCNKMKSYRKSFQKMTNLSIPLGIDSLEIIGKPLIAIK